MARDRSKEVFLDAMGGDKLTNSRQTQAIAAKLATGNYPTGLDDCFVMGTMGQCGLDCFVFRDGECRFPLENLDNHHATAEQAQEIFDEEYYDDVVREYCKLKGYQLNGAALSERGGEDEHSSTL